MDANIEIEKFINRIQSDLAYPTKLPIDRQYFRYVFHHGYREYLPYLDVSGVAKIFFHRKCFFIVYINKPRSVSLPETYSSFDSFQTLLDHHLPCIQDCIKIQIKQKEKLRLKEIKKKTQTTLKSKIFNIFKNRLLRETVQTNKVDI